MQIYLLANPLHDLLPEEIEPFLGMTSVGGFEGFIGLRAEGEVCGFCVEVRGP